MLAFLQLVVGAAVVIVGYLFLRAYTGIYLGEYIVSAVLSFFGFSTKWLQSASKDYATKSKLRFSRENKAQREKDKIYQYYRFVDDILASMGLRQLGITVEGFTIICGFVSVCFAALIGISMQSLFMTLLVFVVGYASILALMYLKSRLGAMDRKKQILLAVDMLSSNMSDGIVPAVQGNMNLIHPSIRPSFKRFIRNITVLNISVEEALFQLNNELGSTFDTFAETVAMYERDRAPGMDVLFSFIVSDNAKETLRDVKIKRASDKVIVDFIASCGILAGVLLYSLSAYDFVRAFYDTPFGRVVLLGYFIAALLIFIATQVIMGKPYIYKEGK